jgi:hypothetical protein
MLLKIMARWILELRAAGKADEVTEAMMSAADDSYMYANTPLDMSQEARMARADEMFPRKGFHGTNADIDVSKATSFLQTIRHLPAHMLGVG